MFRFKFLRASHLVAILALAAIALCGIPRSYAATGTSKSQSTSSFTGWLAASKVTGQLRDYYFTEKYQYHLPFRHSNSLGGWLNIHTPSVWGLSADIDVATAQALGLNSSNPSANVPSLPDTNLTVLQQAYLQYQSHGFQFRAGDQEINTPMASSDPIDYRVIKPSYQGFGASYHISSAFTVYAYRMFRFKGYAMSGYERVDTGKYVNNVIAPLPQVNSIGFGAYGGKWHHGSSTAQVWYYNFYNRLDALYGEYNYHMGIGGHFLKAILLGVQAGKEWNAGSQVASYQNVNSRLYGAQIGFVVPHNIVFLAYNDVPYQAGAFRGGAYVSPYQQGNYDSHTFYTANFGTSLVSETASPGHSFLLKDVLKFPHYHLLFVGEYAITHAPDHYLGASGPLSGVGNAHSMTFVAQYGFAPHWSAKFLYFYVDNNNSFLGRINAGRFYLTYTFPGA